MLARTSRTTAPARPWIRRPLWQVGLAAALVAAAVSVLVYVAARAAGVPMELTEVFEDRFARMPMMNTAWAALLDGGVAGTLLAAACRRWTRRPRSYFLALATAGLIASFALPITSDASTETKVVLAISHVIVAIIIVPALALALPGEAIRHDTGASSSVDAVRQVSR
jgi:peptidoglycan/LPS O-acetylase OafA/YrhL